MPGGQKSQHGTLEPLSKPQLPPLQNGNPWCAWQGLPSSVACGLVLARTTVADSHSPAERVGPPPSRQGRSHLEGTSQGWSCEHQVLPVPEGWVSVRLTGGWEARAGSGPVCRPHLQRSVLAVVRKRQSCEATISCRKGGPSEGTQVLLGRDSGY